MTKQTIVDVIIPVYNQFHVVKNCIESVVKTTSVNNFAITVIDDGSSDLELRDYLDAMESEGAIRRFTNASNLGFTRTVNFGMRLHADRDVVLLNSDTVVYGTWLERLRAAAYSSHKVATVNPLTNSSHISSYPYRENNEGVALEVSDEILDDLAADKNAGKYVGVHTTVGFCVFIKRDCINEIGLFDARNFPIGYGEESDFCYRARKLGWQHLIAGDVFVRHLENQSFGERKSMLMKEMITKFVALHPECPRYDEQFRRLDPLRRLRAGLDLARVKRLLRRRSSLKMYIVPSGRDAVVVQESVALAYYIDERFVQLAASNSKIFPNLERYRMPTDIVRFNAAMRYLGVERIFCRSASERTRFEKQIVPTALEVGLEPKLDVRAQAFKSGHSSSAAISA